MNLQGHLNTNTKKIDVSVGRNIFVLCLESLMLFTQHVYINATAQLLIQDWDLVTCSQMSCRFVFFIAYLVEYHLKESGVRHFLLISECN